MNSAQLEKPLFPVKAEKPKCHFTMTKRKRKKKDE